MQQQKMFNKKTFRKACINLKPVAAKQKCCIIKCIQFYLKHNLFVDL